MNNNLPPLGVCLVIGAETKLVCPASVYHCEGHTLKDLALKYRVYMEYGDRIEIERITIHARD